MRADPATGWWDGEGQGKACWAPDPNLLLICIKIEMKMMIQCDEVKSKNCGARL